MCVACRSARGAPSTVEGVTEVSDRTTSARAAPSPGPRGRPVVDPAATDLTWDAIVSSMPDGTALIDASGVMRFVNDALVRMSGYPRDELVGRDVQMLVPERHRDLEGAARRQYSTDAGAALIWSDLDLSMLCAGGSELPVDFALSPIRVGEESWALAMVRDRSARQTHERARAQAELRSRVAFEYNMAPMTFTDVDDRIIAVNDAFCEMIGFTPRRAHRAGLDALHLPRRRRHHRDHARARDLRRDRAGALREALPAQGRARHRRRGEPLARARRRRSILYFVFSERDITEERALTAQLSTARSTTR